MTNEYSFEAAEAPATIFFGTRCTFVRVSVLHSTGIMVVRMFAAI